MRIFTAVADFFEFSRHGVSFFSESRAGLATFLTMSYIVFVNPLILGDAIPVAREQLLTATALAAAVGSILMGLIARYPFALAPGMGLNAYFTYGMVLGEGVAWETALGAVFISGFLFLALSLTGVRQMIIAAIPVSLRLAIGGGIGLFLAILGLSSAEILVSHPATLISFAPFSKAAPLLAVAGLLVTLILLARRTPGAILIGIIIVSLIAVFSGLAVYEGGTPFSGITGIVALPAWPADLLFAMDIGAALVWGLAGTILALVLVDFFDTAGTLVGLADRCGYLDSKGSLPRAKQAYSADALATMAGAVVGTSPTTTYVESAAGIEDGARTGFAAVVVGVLFLASLFFWPLASAVPAVATAPALIVVGFLMVQVVRRIDWHAHIEGFSAFLILIGIPLSYSIATGIALGITAYVFLSLLAGRWREVHPVMYGLLPFLIWKLW